MSRMERVPTTAPSRASRGTEAAGGGGAGAPVAGLRGGLGGPFTGLDRGGLGMWVKPRLP